MTGSLTQTANPILAHFEAMLPEALEESKDPAGQRAAFEMLRECGLPHRKVEAWKYTDPSGAVAGPFDRPHHCSYGLIAPDSVKVGMIRVFPTIGPERSERGTANAGQRPQGVANRGTRPRARRVFRRAFSRQAAPSRVS